MALANWLRALKRRVYGTHPRATLRKARLKRPLSLEECEPRVMLTTRIIPVESFTDDLAFVSQYLPLVTTQPYSLREALIEAHRATEDTVILELSAGAYNIQRPTNTFIDGYFSLTEGASHVDPYFGDFDIRRNLVIQGNGAAVRGESLGRVFQVLGDVQVTINNLNILNGGGYVAQGAGLHVSGGADVTLNNVNVFQNETLVSSDARGGGLYADNAGGRITINGGDFRTNSARSSPGSTARGGAIYLNGGLLEVNGTSLYLNNVLGSTGNPGAEGGSAYGGALFVESGNVSLTDVSFASNRASAGHGGGRGGRGGLASGGAIYVERSDSFVIRASGLQFDDIRQSTFTGNFVSSGHGGDGDDHGGDGGYAAGGAIRLGLGSVTMTIDGTAFQDNAVYADGGGQGHRSGGDGGMAEGGAIAASVSLDFLHTQHRLTIRDSKFENNLARAGAGGTARDGDAGQGGQAHGGALLVNAPDSGAATLTIEDTPFLHNRAMAGDGGSVRNGPAGRGGHASGGAVATFGPVATTITGTLGFSGTMTSPTSLTLLGAMIGNAALGGSGGEKLFDLARPWSSRDAAGDGGYAEGGALATNTGGSLHVTQITFASNTALAGNGGDGDPAPGLTNVPGTRGGNSGAALGGALFTSVDTTLEQVTFARNVAAGGRLDAQVSSQYGDLHDVGPLAGGVGGRDHDGNGLDGGRGGLAEGGAVLGRGANLTIRDAGFLGNQAIGGIGGPGGAGMTGEGTHDGGYGGEGGNALGGAIMANQVPTLVLTNSFLAGNVVLAGRGGSGGRGGDNTRSEGFGGDGGVGGDGGDARGGGLMAAYLTLTYFPANATSISNSVFRNNVAVAGDGGFAGNGGGGRPTGGMGGRFVRVLVDHHPIFGDLYDDVPVGGGHGGDAMGGGIDLDGATATIERTTVERNAVSSGWGAAGGYGGPGSGVGGPAGPGGDGGDAHGGGIAVAHGTLTLGHSTVFANVVTSGAGGQGGFGGVGVHQEGGNGGDGGNGGNARGGGVFIDGSVPASGFSSLAVTVASNLLKSGAPGFGGAPGKSPHDVHPIRYDAAPGQSLNMGALGAVPADYLEFLATSSNGAIDSIGGSSANAFGFDPVGAIAGAGGALLVGGAVGATVGVALYQAAWGASFAANGAVAAFFGTKFAASVAFVGAASAFGTVSSVAAGAGLFIMVGGAVLTKFLIGGITTGDWEGAMANALGTPGKVYPYQFSFLLTGVRQEDEEEEPVPPPPGVPGQDGAPRAIEGINLYGHGSLSRTLVAGGTAMRQQWERRRMPATDTLNNPILVYQLNETTADLRNPGPTEIQTFINDYDGSFVTNGTNLIGILNFSSISDLHGSTFVPLSPKLDTETRLNGGTTPTLKLLAGSPARSVIRITGSDLSQNGHVWSTFADIGAWGGVANRAPVTVRGARTVPQNGSVSMFVRDLLANDSDPDGDTVRILGGAAAFTAQHGTIRLFGDPNSPSALLVYTPDTDYLGPDVVSYQVSDGQFTVGSSIDLSVLPARFTGLSDHTIVFGTPQLNLSGTIVVGETPVRSFFDHVNISFAGFRGVGIEVDAFGHFLTSFYPGTNLAPSDTPYPVTYEYYDQGNLVAVGTSQITVTQAPLKRLHWTNPADISYGTPLSTAQLNAVAIVSNGDSGERPMEGTYDYTPGLGLLLPAGNGQALSLVFTPDEPEYLVTTAEVVINVRKATPTLVVVGREVDFNGQPQPASFSLTGALRESLTRYLIVTYTDTAGNTSTAPPVNPGNYRVTASFAGNENYNAVSNSSTFVVIGYGPPVTRPGSASTDEDTAVLVDLWALVSATATPVETLTFQVGSPQSGTVELLADGHTAQFTPAANSNGAGAQFLYTVTAPANPFGPAVTTAPQPVVIQVAPVNDAPENTLPAVPTVDEDTPLRVLGVGVSDVDLAEGADTMKVTLRIEHGTLSLGQTTGLTFDVGDGTDDATVTFSGSKAAIDAAFAELTYNPTANFNGTDHLHILTDDLANFGAGGPRADSDTLDIIVTAVNDTPVAHADRYTTPGDTPLTVAAPGVLANDTDIDFQFEGDQLVVASHTQPARGVVTLNADGAFTYTPPLNYFGTVSFTYTLRDRFGATATSTVTIEVARVPSSVGPGSTAGVGFWANANGQNLIQALNGSPGSKALGNWLASAFANLYGKKTGANNLAGATNTQVASYFTSLFNNSNKRLETQVLATALALYATRTDLNTTAAGQALARSYGFEVTATGTGDQTFNVGTTGSAFGVADGTRLTVLDMLRRTNDRAVNGVLWNGDLTMRRLGSEAFGELNQLGNI